VSRLLAQLLEAVRPDLLAWALASLRVLPVTFLCPVLGGQLVPAPVRLAVAGALALALRPLVGNVPEGSSEVLVRGGREATLGLLIGMGAALPFDAARIGGRLVDLVRGTSAEAALPVAGHREAATGDLLHQLLLSVAVAGGGLPVLVHALARSYLLALQGTRSPAAGRSQ
jgi:type III secretory pathway component EscT